MFQTPRPRMLPCLLALAILARAGAAGAPGRILFQGELQDPPGSPVRGSHLVTYRIYPTSVSGVATFVETEPVAFSDTGAFISILGDGGTPLGGGSLPDEAYLGVAIDGGAELAPRIPLLPVPYSVRALRADEAASLRPESDLSMAGRALLQLADPPAPDSAATRRYVDAALAAALGDLTARVAALEARLGPAAAPEPVSTPPAE